MASPAALADADRDRVVIFLTDDQNPDWIRRTFESAGGDWNKAAASVRRHPLRRCLL